MTTLELRDELARLAGWVYRNGRWYHPKWHRLGSGQKRHPIPDTLDEAAKLPEGWTWSRFSDRWQVCYFPNWSPEARKRPEKTVEVPDTGNELHDRFALRLECERAMRKRSRHE